MRMVPIEKYNPIRDKLQGKRIIYAPGDSGIAGEMIDYATQRLFDLWGVTILNDFRSGEYPEVEIGDQIDCLVYGGGGTLGCTNEEVMLQRKWLVFRYAIDYGLPVIVLPQSYAEGFEYKPRNTTIFARDINTWMILPRTTLIPDIALSIEFPDSSPEPEFERGIFLRKDRLGISYNLTSNNIGDPDDYCSNWMSYFHLAARFKHVVTDRLHFALCALAAKRTVTLLPDALKLNQYYHVTWLRDQCKFVSPRI